VTRMPRPLLGVVVALAVAGAHDDPQPGEIYLYGPRKDLVSSR
jgi:hypothetical protein